MQTALGCTGVITTATTPVMGSINRYNAAGGALAVPLAALSGLNVGARAVVQKDTLDPTTNAVTFTCTGADTFDDATTSVAVISAGEQIEVDVVSIAGVKHWKVVGNPATSISGYINSANAWVARNPGSHLVPIARATYYDKPTTAWASLPTTFDTGQPVTYSDSGSANNRPTITGTGGGLQLPRGTGGGGSAFYANLDAGAGNSLTRIGVKFKVNNTGSTTTGWAMGLAMSNGPTVLFGGTAYRIGVHLVVGENTYGLTKVSNATGSLVFTTLATGALSSTLVADNVTEYTIEGWRVGNTFTMVLPDGQRIAATDTDIGTWSTQYGFFEPVLVNHDTDAIPSITEAWYDINAQYPPGSAGLITQAALAPYAKLAGSTLVLPTVVVYDNALYIYNHSDATKLGLYDVSGVTTGNTRTVKWPNVDCTMGAQVAAPATSSSAGVAGSYAYDSSNFYICIAANTWKRVAVSTF